MGWATEGVKNKSTAGTILADTGQLVAGIQNLTIFIWTNVGGIIEFAQRDSLNGLDVASQRLSVIETTKIIQIPVNFALNQRLVIRAVESYVGNIQASIIW